MSARPSVYWNVCGCIRSISVTALLLANPFLSHQSCYPTASPRANVCPFVQCTTVSFLDFSSFNFRFFIFVLLLLLFFLNFTINLSAYNFFLTDFRFPLKHSVFIFILHFSVYFLPRRFIFAQPILRSAFKF